MKLTDEQEQAKTSYATGSDLVLEAYAGTGKTTTIVELCQSDRRPGTYVAYNKAIVEDVRDELDMKAPHVKARTAHSLAFGAVGRRYVHRLSSERMSSREIAKRLGIAPFSFKVRGEERRLMPAFLAGSVMEGTRHFANSADMAPALHHLPTIEGMDEPDEDMNNYSYRIHLIDALRAAWSDLADPYGALRFSHDCYLKLWQLGTPEIPGEVLFVDEAQDINPVLADIVTRQGGQIVAVGDSYQQIYAWRGSIDTLRILGEREGTKTGRLTVSFRFGPEIATVANRLLIKLGAPAMINGAGDPGAVERSEEPDAILCRTNAGVISSLISHLPHRKCAIVGGGGDLVRFAKAIIDLQTNGKTTHPELVCFDSIEELEAYVADDPSGSDLALLTRLCLKYGPEKIIAAVQATSPEHTPGVLTLSTAHRAKGRQWPEVRLGADWPERTLDSPDELRLAYVAVTRARHILDLSECVILSELS